MKVSTMIKSAWMHGWNSSNTQYTDMSREISWTSSISYRHYKKALVEEKSLKGDTL